MNETKTQNFYYKTNRLQQLRGFYYTVQLGTVSAAARQMGLQQSAVSMQIQALERDLSVQLFKQKKPKLILTEEGSVLHNLAGQYIEGIDSIYERFSENVKEEQNKRLILTANHISIAHLLPKAVNSCRQAFPKLNVDIHNVNRSAGFEMLRKNEAQAYIGAIQDYGPEFDFTPIVEYETICLVREDHPLTKIQGRLSQEHVKQYDMIWQSHENMTVPAFVELIDVYNIRTPIFLENGDWELFKCYARTSDVTCLISAICTEGNMDGLKALPLDNMFSNVRYGIITKKGKWIAEPLKVLIEDLKKFEPAGY